MIAEAVVDTSAILAAVRREPGGDRIRDVVQLRISAVNFAELFHVMSRQGLDVAALDQGTFKIHSYDQADAFAAARFMNATRRQGLSLGDCACLALAKRLELPVLTADRAWAALDLGVEVVLIR